MQGVTFLPLAFHHDDRGSLCELFRDDEIEHRPQMGYASITLPGVVRGPHEHKKQTDCFCFFDGKFELWLWSNRHGLHSSTVLVGREIPTLVIIPPGIVHAYKNVGDQPALVLNFPDRLYRGLGKKERPDEIRHENKPNSPYKVS